MSINKMLIDATHPEETRVVVLKNGRVEEFDFESAARKLLRGNIYLAKVTRVEPSLQAAFVDYGGNRHGFLAFSEIHPDYYQIPVADRQALIEEEAAQEAAEEAEVDAHAERLARRRQRSAGPGRPLESRGDAPVEGGDVPHDHDGHHEPAHPEGDAAPSETGEHAHRHHDDHDDEHHTIAALTGEVEQIIVENAPPVSVGGFDPDAPEASHHEAHDHDHPHHGDAEASSHAHSHVHDDGEPASEAEPIEETGADEMVEELPERPRRRLRSYKIQEVIKRRQIILVQVVKEERGNKGAALTTYLSLAGRYTVLMPNTARGGGISRKITQPGDRKRLKAIANELEVPEGMGLIVRTAGAARSSQEIKRDFEYLLRLWESVRELTLESTAPSLVYEEGNLIKRSIRDLYNKDVEEVVVAGEVAHREAQDFMRMLMPSHAKNVVLHKGTEPLFTRYRMEQQLGAMFSPQVTLKSGGYLVINQTEALVAIDVNSGKSTREYSIEETALNTNLEAAEEIARQLKLRDLAGLIVIDFIDMDEKRNNRSVERRLKDSLRFDRARIQLGRISHFGLMEMSRQRLRTGVLEGSTTQCPHCQGTGIIRSIESVALAVIRGLEDALMSGTRLALVATTTPAVALYILNSKRAYITDMEARHGLSITVSGSDKLQGANFTIDKVATSTAEPALRRRSASAVNMEWGFSGDEGDEPALEHDHHQVPELAAPLDDEDGGDQSGDRGPRDEPPTDGGSREEGRRRRRGRGRRGRRDERPGEERGNAGTNFTNPDQPRGGYDDDAGGDNRIIEVGSGDDAVEEIGAEGAEPIDTRSDAEGSERQTHQGGPGSETDPDGRPRRGRRRGRRGGRRNGRDRERSPNAANDANAPNGSHEPGPEGHDHDHDTGPGEHDHAQPVAGHDRPARYEHIEPADTAPAGAAAPSHPATGPVPVREHQPTVREHRPVVREPAAMTTRPADVEAPVHAPTVHTPAPAEPVAAVVEPKPRRASTSSEPVLERVVVTPHTGSEAHATDTDAPKPSRRGWWQKKLGLE